MVEDTGTHAPYPGSWLGDPGVLAELSLLEAAVEVKGEEQGPGPCPWPSHLGTSHLNGPNSTKQRGLRGRADRSETIISPYSGLGLTMVEEYPHPTPSQYTLGGHYKPGQEIHRLLPLRCSLSH